MKSLSKNTFLTVAALATDKVTIVTYPNGDWFACANFYFTPKNKWVYVDTQMYYNKAGKDKFERQVKNNGLEIEHETVTIE